MTDSIQLPISAGQATLSVESLAQSLDHVTAKFSNVASGAKDIKKISDWLTEASKSGQKTTKMFDDLGGAGARSSAALTALLDKERNANAVFTEQENRVRKVVDSFLGYDQALGVAEQSVKTMELKNRALIETLGKYAQANVHAEATAQALMSDEAKSAIITDKLNESTQRLISSRAKASDQYTGNMAQAQIFEAQSAATIKLANSEKLLLIQTELYQKLLSQGIAVHEAAAKAAENEYTAQVNAGSALSGLKKQRTELAATMTKQAIKEQALVEMMKAEKATTLDLLTVKKNLSEELKRYAGYVQRGVAADQAAVVVAKAQHQAAVAEASALGLLAVELNAIKAARDSSVVAKQAELTIAKKALEVDNNIASMAGVLKQAYRELAASVTGEAGAVQRSIASLQARKKAMLEVASAGARLSGAEKVAAEELRLLNAGIGVNTTAYQARAKGIKDAAAVEAKLTAQMGVALKEIEAYTTGIGKAAQKEIQRAEILKTAAVTEARMAELQKASTQEIYKRAGALTSLIEGYKKIGSYEQDMINKTNLLGASIKFLTTEQGKHQSALAAEEAALKKYNNLLAQTTPKYQALQKKIKALETSLAAQDVATKKSVSSLAQLKKELKSIASSTLITNNAVQGLRSTLYGLGASFGMFTSSTLLVSAAVYGLVSQIRTTIAVGASLQDSIARVAAISYDASSSVDSYEMTLKKLDERAIAVAATSRFMATDVVEAMNELAMAGLRTEDIMFAVRDVMNLAAIGAIGFGEAADISTNIMMGFRLQVEDLGDVIDKMTVAVTSSNQNISQLGNALSYAAPIASSFGTSLNFVVAATEVLANSGIKASRAGTALRRVLISLYTPTKKGSEAMESLGIATTKLGEDFSGMEMMDAPLKGLLGDTGDTTNDLIEKLEKLYMVTDGATKNIGLLVDIVGVRAAPAFAQLVASMGKGVYGLTSFMEALDSASGATEDRVKKMSDTLVYEWKVMLSAIEATQQRMFNAEYDPTGEMTISSSLRNTVVGYSGMFQSLAADQESLNKVAQSMKVLATEAGKLVLGLVALKVAFAGLSLVTRVYAAVLTLTNGIWAAVSAIAAYRTATAAGTAATLAAGGAAGITTTALASLTAAWTGAGLAAGLLGVRSVAATVALQSLWVVVRGLGAAITAAFRFLIIPAAVIGGIYLLADRFFDLEGIIQKVKDAWNDLTGAMDASQKKITDQADELFQTDKYEEKKQEMINLQKQLADMGANGNKTEDDIKRMNELRKEIREVKGELEGYQEVLSAWGKQVYFKKLQDQMNTYNDLVAEVARKEQTVAKQSQGTKQNSPVIQESTESLARLKKEMEDAKVLLDEMRVKYEAYTGTGIEKEKALGVALDTNAQKRAKIEEDLAREKKARDELIDVQEKLVGDTNQQTNYKNVSDDIEEYRKSIADLEKQLASLREEEKKLQAARQATDIANPNDLSQFNSQISDLESRLSQLADKTYSSTAQTKIAKNIETVVEQAAALTNLKTQLKGLRSSFEAVSKGAAADSKPSEDTAKELRTQISDVTSAMRALEKGADESSQAIEDVINKYDEASKKSSDLYEEMVSLSLATAASGRGTEFLDTALKQLIGSTLEVDEATGKLTKTSVDAVNSLKSLISNQITDLTNDMNALLDGENQDSKTQAKVEALRAVIDNLQTSLDLVTSGGLEEFVMQQKTAADSANYARDAYQAQIDVLNMLGQTIEATNVSRKKEIESASDMEKSVLKLKYALEDLDKAKSDALDASSLTEDMQSFFSGLSDEAKRSVGFIKVNWFDPSETVRNSNTLKTELGETFAAMTGLNGQIATSLDTNFTSLSAHLQEIKEQALEAIKEIALASDELSFGGSGRTSTSSSVRAVSGPRVDNFSANTGDEIADRILDAIGKAEAPRGYDQVYSKYEAVAGQQSITDKTLKEIFELQEKMISEVGGSPVGKYQFIKSTLEQDVKALGISLETTFSPMVQDQLGMYELVKAGYDKMTDKLISWEAFQSNVSGVWAGVPAGASGTNRYDGYNGNRPTITDAQFDAARPGSTTTTDANTRALRNNEQALSDVANAQKTAAVETEKSTSAITSLSSSANAATPLVEQFNQAGSLSESLAASIAELEAVAGAALQKYVASTQEMSQADLDSAETKARLGEEMDLIKGQYAQLAYLKDQLYLVETKEIENGQKLFYTYKLSEERIRALADSYNTLGSQTSKAHVDIANWTALLEAGAVSAKEYADAVEAIADGVISSSGAWGEYWVETKNQIQGMDEILVDLTDDFRGKLVDSLVDGTPLKMDDFVDTVKRKLAELAVNTLVVNIVGNVAGITGTSGSLLGLLTGGSTDNAAAGGITSGSSLLSSLSGLTSIGTKLSNAWSWIGSNSIGTSVGRWVSGLSAGQAGPLTQTGAALAGTSNIAYLGAGSIGGLAGSYVASELFDGDYVGIGSTLGGVAGGVGGGIAAGALAGSVVPVVGTLVGAFLGAVAGGGLGSLFGSSEPRFGGYATSFSGHGLEDNVSAQGAFGLNFGISDKGSKNMDAAEYQETLDGLAAVSNSLSSFFGTELSNSIQVKLRDRLGDFNDWGDDLGSYFASLFGTILNYAADASTDANGVGAVMAAAMDGLGGLTGTVQEMSQKIEDAMNVTSGAYSLFDTDIGEILGMHSEGMYASVAASAQALSEWGQSFRQEGETMGDTLSRLAIDMAVLARAMELSGDQIEGMTNAGYSFVAAAQRFAEIVVELGTDLDTLSALQTQYYDEFFTEEEKALFVKDAAMEKLNEFNTALGLSGDAFIDTKEELRAYIESLKDANGLMDEANMEAYVSAMLASTAILDLDAAMETLYGSAEGAAGVIRDFIDSITPDEVYAQQAVDLFAEWDLPFPATSDALYEMIQAGMFTTEQLYKLSQAADVLNSAWGYIEGFRDSAIDELTDRYNDKKDAENDRYDDEKKALKDASEDRLKALEDEHDAEMDRLNEELDKFEEAIDVFADAADTAYDAMRSLMKVNEGIDKTRQRYLEEAQGIIDIIKAGGTVLPDYINEVIGGLGDVDANDFATREEYEAAIAENMAMLESLYAASSSKEGEYQDQIDLLKEQIKLEEDNYEKAKEDEDDRLDRELEAAEKLHEENLDKLEDEFEDLKGKIEDASIEQLIELLIQNGLLADQIDLLKAISENIYEAIGVDPDGLDLKDPDVKDPLEESVFELNKQLAALFERALPILESIRDAIYMLNEALYIHLAPVLMPYLSEMTKMATTLNSALPSLLSAGSPSSKSLRNAGDTDPLLDDNPSQARSLRNLDDNDPLLDDKLSQTESSSSKSEEYRRVGYLPAIMKVEEGWVPKIQYCTDQLSAALTKANIWFDEDSGLSYMTKLDEGDIAKLGQSFTDASWAVDIPRNQMIGEGNLKLSEISASVASQLEATAVTSETNQEVAAEVAAMVEEMRKMREEAKASAKSVAENTQKVGDMVTRWEELGMPQARHDLYDTVYKVEDVTPAPAP